MFQNPPHNYCVICPKKRDTGLKSIVQVVASVFVVMGICLDKFVNSLGMV